MSKIVRLEAEQFKRLKAVHIRPDGSMVEIRGANGAGKSSCLDAIAAALGGEKLCPEVPIRRGQDSARVEVELDDGMIVERRWTPSGTRLEVRTKEGAKFGSPQKILDGITGRLTFDPLAFMREKPERQAETLRALVGVDFTLLDGKRRAAYDGRTEANRQLAAAKARLAAIPVVDAPDAPVSAADLIEEQDRRRAQHDTNEAVRRNLAHLQDVYRKATEGVALADQRIADLERDLAAARDARRALTEAQEDLKTKGKALKAEVEQLVDPNLDEIPAKLREVETINERVRQKKARATEAEHVKAAEAMAAKLTADIEAIDAQKAEVLAGAAFPVPGLAFADAGVTLNGLPLEQASSAEQLRVSVAMGLALNPKLKVLLIRDGSLLDERSLAMVAEAAEKAGAQVWIEMVGKGGAGLVIEDGQVEGAEPAKEAAHG